MIDKSPIDSISQLEVLDQEIKKLVESGAKGPSAWRSALDIAIKYNPVIQMEVLYVTEQNAKRREENRNRFGESGDKSMRAPVSLPQSVMMLFRAVDPEFKISSEDRVKSEKTIEKLFKAFPEFRTAEAV